MASESEKRQYMYYFTCDCLKPYLHKTQMHFMRFNEYSSFTCAECRACLMDVIHSIFGTYDSGRMTVYLLNLYYCRFIAPHLA